MLDNYISGNPSITNTSTSNSGRVQTRMFARRLSVVKGCIGVSNHDSNMDRIKEILRQVDDKNREQTAAILLSVLKKELRGRWVIVALAIVAACATELALIFGFWLWNAGLLFN